MAAPISAAAVSVGEAAVPALLIAPGNLPSALGAGERRAPAGAVDLSPIAATADQHLGPAALAEEEAAGVLENGLVTAAATWTQNGVGAIISRQSCPARFRARRRCELPSCRSAPRLLPRPVERLKHATRSCQRPPAKPRPPDLNHPADNLPRAHPRVHPTGPQATSHGLHGIPRRPPRKPQSRRRRRISALPDARQHAWPVHQTTVLWTAAPAPVQPSVFRPQNTSTKRSPSTIMMDGSGTEGETYGAPTIAHRRGAPAAAGCAS
jgi:hypothetical protein